MIPRFIMLSPKESLLVKLEQMGYERKSHPLSKDVLVLGTSLLNSSEVPQVKNPLIRIFGSHQEADILVQAELQRKWTNTTVRAELQLGASKKGKVIVTPLGVMIDSCIIPIDDFRKLQARFARFEGPFLASHTVLINHSRPFFTVGCDDYSLEDLTTIISTYNTLLQPAS